MKTQTLEHQELGLSLHFWEGTKKPERVFLATEIMKQLGYSGGTATLKNYDLIENVDFVVILKRKHPTFFEEVLNLKYNTSGRHVLGRKSYRFVCLYESGIWKLIQQSKKPIGVKTRHWLATEVLPSIYRTGKYEITNGNTMLSAFFDHTERVVQLAHSKEANAAVFQTPEKNFKEYHDRLHKIISGMSAAEIKEYYKSKKSAREIIREQKPENACVYSFFDEAIQAGIPLDTLIKESLHESLKPVFKSLLKIGWFENATDETLTLNPDDK